MNNILGPDTEINQIIEIAHEAGRVLMHHFARGVEVKYKDNDKDNPSTIADLESEKVITAGISRLFPDDTILAEESPDLTIDYARRVWMIDPLDGTNYFIEGKDGFAIHIGLWDGESLQIGVVHLPGRQETYFARRGSGALLLKDGQYQKLHTSDCNDLSSARIVIRTSSRAKGQLDHFAESLPVKAQLAGQSIGNKIGMIVTAQAELNIHTNLRASKWDTAGPQLILTEAGGVISDFEGQPLNYRQPELVWRRSFVASANPTIHQAVLAVIAQSDIDFDN